MGALARTKPDTRLEPLPSTVVVVAAIALVLSCLPGASAVPAGCSTGGASGQELTSCSGFTGADLNLDGQAIDAIDVNAFSGLTLNTLQLTNNELTTLPVGVFDGLTTLVSLTLTTNLLTSLPAGVFDAMTELQELTLGENQLTTLPAGLFAPLTKLTTLGLSENKLSALPTGAFDTLTKLETLDLFRNELSSLPDGLFDFTSGLTSLSLNNNQLAAIPAGLFDGLVNVTSLPLYNNQLTTLPAGLLDSMTSVTLLELNDNKLTSLPPGLLGTMTSLNFVKLHNNQLAAIPAGSFDACSQVTSLTLYNNKLVELPSGLFDHLTSLTTLRLNINKLATVPANVFDSLTSLQQLYLSDNQLTALPAGLFDSMGSLTGLFLQNNMLRQLPPFAFTALAPTCTVNVQSNPLLPQPCGVGNGVWQDTRFSFGYCTSFPAPGCSRNGQVLLSCAGFKGNSLSLNNFNLTSMAPGALAGLSLSGVLDLSHNGFTAVAPGVMAGTSADGTISLAYNNLTEVPLSVFGDVVAGTVDLRHNPLLRLPSAALSPHYTDFVTNAVATPVSCLEPGFAWFAWKGSSFCTRCLPGNYCPGGSNLPTECPVGTFNSLVGQHSSAACVPCSQGTYGDSRAAVSGTSCAYCPAGTWSASLGATSITTCTPCLAGTIASGLGNAACSECPAGTFQSQPGRAKCTLCPAGTYGAATGATSNASCTTCPADRPTSAPGSVVLSDCSDDATEACAAGWHYSSASDSCVQCTPGYSCPGGLAPRQLCPAGSYSDAPQAAECTLCLAGTYGRGTGGTSASDCMQCPPGAVSTSDGAAACTPCAAGTSQASPGMQSCAACPDDTLCPAGSVMPLPLTLAPSGVSVAAASGPGNGGDVDAVVPLDGSEEAEVSGAGGSGGDHSAFGTIGTWAVPVGLLVVAGVLLVLHKRIPSALPQRLDLFAYSHKRANNAAVRQHPTRLGFACSLVFLLAALLLTWSLWTAPNEVYTTALATKAEVARRPAATSTLQLRIVAYGVNDETECVLQVSATALGVGSADGGSVTTSGGGSATGVPVLQLQHDAPTQRCTITVACTECPLQPSATVSYSIPWHFQLLGWNVSAVSPRASSSVGGTAAPQAGGLLSGSAAFEVAWVPSFLVVEGDGGKGEVQESGHLLQFRSAQAQQVAASGAGVSSGSDSTLKLEFAFPISDVGHTTVVQTAQTVQQRAASILAAVVSVLSAARFVYIYFELGVDTVEARVDKRKGGDAGHRRRQTLERRGSVNGGVAMMRMRSPASGGSAGSAGPRSPVADSIGYLGDGAGRGGSAAHGGAVTSEVESVASRLTVNPMMVKRGVV